MTWGKTVDEGLLRGKGGGEEGIRITGGKVFSDVFVIRTFVRYERNPEDEAATRGLKCATARTRVIKSGGGDPKVSCLRRLYTYDGSETGDGGGGLVKEEGKRNGRGIPSKISFQTGGVNLRGRAVRLWRHRRLCLLPSFRGRHALA